MNKAEHIKKMIDEGKSFDEIVETGVAKSAFVKQTFTKNGVDWKKEPVKHESSKTVNELIEASKKIEGAPVELVEDPEPLPPVANPVMQFDPQQMAMITAMAQTMATAMVEAQKPTKEKRRDPNKCFRHPDETVKPGENCPQCLENCKQDMAHTEAYKYTLPCPKCKSKRWAKDGGTIHRQKNNTYSCGNCKISYNAKGEQTPWGPKDYHCAVL